MPFPLSRPRYLALMAEAVALAAAERPHPNPRVGALVVDDEGRVLGAGVHTGPGTPHAEPRAIAAAGDGALGATLVVTLEPHDHQSRTPPCTEAIIAAGLSRVVIGAIDPNPRVAGRGVARLRAAGIETMTGVAADEVETNDPGYFHWRRTGRARFVHKAALTLDGQTAAADGTSQWITGVEARSDAHRLRASVDAVMVGAGTVIADDPLLTVRLPERPGFQPRPIVVAGRRPLPPAAAVLGRHPIVFSPVPLDGPGEVVVVPGAGGSADLVAAARILPEMGVLDVLVEGGATLAGSLLRSGLVDQGVWYVAARVAGGIGRAVFDQAFETLSTALDVEITDVRMVGGDVRLDWRPAGRPS